MMRVTLTLLLFVLAGCHTPDYSEPVQATRSFSEGSNGWEFMVQSYVDKVYFKAKEADLPIGSLPYYDPASQGDSQKLIGTVLIESNPRIDPEDREVFYREVIDRVNRLETIGQ